MAKTTRMIVTVTDDLDGSTADRTVTFAFEGTTYEIDLSKKNARAFERELAPYIGAARRVRATRRSSVNGARKHDLSAIREWAQSNGYEVAPRGRIAGAVVEAYEAAR